TRPPARIVGVVVGRPWRIAVERRAVPAAVAIVAPVGRVSAVAMAVAHAAIPAVVAIAQRTVGRAVVARVARTAVVVVATAAAAMVVIADAARQRHCGEQWDQKLADHGEPPFLRIRSIGPAL